MKTRRSLPIDAALLVGYLDIGVGMKLKPVLVIDCWCLYCKATHRHGWNPNDTRADAVTHRIAPCVDGSPLQGHGYHIGLDPSHREHNRDVLAQYAVQLERWQRRQDRLAAASTAEPTKPAA